MMNDLTISLIQSDLYWEQIEANLAMFEEKIWEMKTPTDLIILPEMFTTGFSMNAAKMAESTGGKTFKWMRQMAEQQRAAITGSFIVKEDGFFFNRLYFVYPDGSSRQYDKKHLFLLAGEHQSYKAGNDRTILAYKGWKIHPMICYDLRFPVWARSQKNQQQLYEYDLLLYIASWPEARINAWDALLKARAIENLSYCAGVNRIGTDAFLKEYPGHSAIYAFDGEVLAFSDRKPEVLTASLSANNLQKFRNRFPFQENADAFILK